jgi:maleylacetate reductase
MKAFVHEQLPGRVVFGPGTFARLAEEVDRLGVTRVLLISDGAAKATSDEAAEALGERVAARISEVHQHVPAEDAARVGATAREAGVDGLVTIGGGSATGLAKAVALELPVVITAVPTTYAGSELTPIYGITRQRSKQTGRDVRVLPRTVIYDPALTVALPADVTASSGLNALAHCVEALYDGDPSPIVELMAEEAVRALARGIPASVRHPDDLDARGDALYGAYLAGAVLAVSRMALHHTISHVLGGTYGLTHGPINAALLPHVARFNGPAAPDAMRRLAAALGVADAPGGIYDLAASVGAPTSLAAIGMDESKLAEAAHLSAQSVKWNPRPVGEDDVLAVLRDAYAGTRPVALPPAGDLRDGAR